MTSVTIPNCVTTIGSYAFINCSGLNEVTIPDSVTKLYPYSFRNCSGLTQIAIPESVTEIDAFSFFGCSGLKSIDIPEGVQSIEGSVFRGCSGLASISIPHNVTNIGSRAFYGCSDLKQIDIPNSVVEIGGQAFMGCFGISNLVVPLSVESIGAGAFSHTHIKKLYLPARFEGQTDSFSIPQDCSVHFYDGDLVLTLEEALDAEELVWMTDGDMPWVPQIAVSSDGADAAKSGAVVGESVSRLSTVVTNSGTLAWKWKADVAGSAGVEVYLDGEDLYDAGIYLEGTSDWADASLEITGDGEHVVTFEYWNGGTAATISDCAYVDQVSWTPDKPSLVVVEGVEIPVAWLDENAASAVAAAGGDYEAAARLTAANGADKLWQCYVSGVSPTNATSRLIALIGFHDRPQRGRDKGRTRLHGRGQDEPRGRDLGPDE